MGERHWTWMNLRTGELMWQRCLYCSKPLDSLRAQELGAGVECLRQRGAPSDERKARAVREDEERLANAHPLEHVMRGQAVAESDEQYEARKALADAARRRLRENRGW